ncbi:MAG: GAF domain-containing protein [Nitrospirae bacterium]|nr:GAF domain-containing protein [Nitrospirota bacterium]
MVQTTNAILAVSLKPMSLQEQCRAILDILMSIPWMHIENKGSIFLSDEDTKVLTIAAAHNFTLEQLSTCATVPYGKCLCGLAASTRAIVYTPDSKEDAHSTRYSEMRPHGHYCVPIDSGDRLLGVINIYLSEGYKRSDEDETLLRNIAGTIAGVVLRKESEDKISQNFLIQGVINQILMISLEPVSLKEQLQKVLDIISDVPVAVKEHYGMYFCN